MNNPVRNYLRLSSAYCQFLGGVRWSSEDDALAYPDGSTFAFNEEIAQLLDGFSSGGHLIHFGHMLHLFDLLRDNRPAPSAEAARLREMFAAVGRSLRNAGAFFAVVCRDLPRIPEDVVPEEVCARLRNTAMPIRWFIVTFHDTFAPAESAPLTPADFEQRVLSATAAYNDDELLAWFRTGRGPVQEAGEAVAREVPRRRTLDGVLGSLLERPRLAGAQGFVSQLVGALTLPPRRLHRQELAVGGYSDVTAHGRFDQILPSQFALDEEDFLRRLAENELLYFRREEPPNPTRHELAVLLDQGVRTWGDVRLVLSAAVLALGRQAGRRGVPFLVAATANDGRLIDPLEADGEALGALVEASDLSANPGLALERVLEERAEAARDVVLLTHPRSLLEEDVLAAARRVAPPVRLFAVAMDATGAVELSELRHGARVRLRQLQIDFRPSAPKPVRRSGPVELPGSWGGDVEPVGFPFRFGVGGTIKLGGVAFDHSGDWLLVASDHGMLYAWKTDGSGAVVLPRGMLVGEVLIDVERVQGVKGGFVVVGRTRSRSVLLHYDFTARTCLGHELSIPNGPPALCYAPAQHAIVITDRLEPDHGYALDLATRERFPHLEPTAACRAKEAWAAWLQDALPYHPRWLRRGPLCDHEAALPSYQLNSETGEVEVKGVKPHWQPFTPLADGRPLLLGAWIIQAQCPGTTLALVCGHPGSRASPLLRLFRGPQGVLVGEYPTGSKQLYELSSDGEWFARGIKRGRLEIRRVDGSAPPVTTRAGGFCGDLKLQLGRRCLVLDTGPSQFYLLWTRDTLEIHKTEKDGGATWPPTLVPGDWDTVVGVPSFLQYDPERFTQAISGEVLVVGDRYGQAIVFDRRQRLVCMFFAFRQSLAGWMPDGTRFGPTWITGAPETPGARAKFGRALYDACHVQGDDS
jgi:hypothetical protein